MDNNAKKKTNIKIKHKQKTTTNNNKKKNKLIVTRVT